MIKNDTMGDTSALDIYQAGYNSSATVLFNKSDNYVDPKYYLEILMRKIIDEYECKGFCEFVDYVIENRIPLDIVSFGAILYVEAYFQSGQNKIGGNYKKYITIKKNGKIINYTWEDIEKTSLVSHKYNYGIICENIKELRKIGQQAHLFVIKKEAGRISDVGTYQGTDSMMNDVMNEPSYYNYTIKDSEYDVKMDIIDFESDVRFKAAKKCFGEEMAASKMELNREIADILGKRDEQILMMERQNETMVKETNSIHASWSGELTNTIRELDNIHASWTGELTNIKNELYEYINQWQKSLYVYEFEQLAQCFVDLYKIVKVDRLIEREAAYSSLYSDKDKGVVGSLNKKDSTENDFNGYKGKGFLTKNDKGVTANENVRTYLPETITGLQKLNRTLTIFIKKFEVALNGIGLYAYFPNEGEPFDEVWHILDDGDENVDTSKSVIKRCILPGISKRFKYEREDNVIIPATVEIEKR